MLPGLAAAASFVVLAGNTPMAALSAAALASLISLCLLAEEGRAERLGIVIALFIGSGFAVFGSGQIGFNAIRIASSDAWPAAVALVLAGAIPLAVWACWRSIRSSPALVAAPVAALYLAARTLLDLSGPATPVWWGTPSAGRRWRRRFCRGAGRAAWAGAW